MWKIRVVALILLIAGISIGLFLYDTEVNPNSKSHFKLGLDLASGTQLIYRADVSKLAKAEVSESMEALRSVAFHSLDQDLI